MASTSGSSSWAQLGAAALGGVLSYEAGQANNVPSATQGFTTNDVASLYYGQNALGQPTVGYNPAGVVAVPSTGVSGTEMLVIGGLVIAAVVAFFLLRKG